MSKHAWFGPKKYGYGYSPVSWEGWLLSLTYALALVGGLAAFSALFHAPPSPWKQIIILGWIAGVTALFFWIANRHTEGEMRWRWGND